MKKITLSLVFLLTMVMGGYGQVAVGEGTNIAQNLPFNPFYGYSYSQSIYLASEINATGSITSIQWYYAGTSAMANSQNLTIYLGQTSKTNFESSADYIGLTGLTAVYTGGFPTGSTAGWKTITFTTPFSYDGISNLVVATDENMASYDAFSDKFRNTAVGANRSIVAFADSTNLDPGDPTNDLGNFVSREISGFVPTVIFGGITQACPNPSAILASAATTSQVTASWTAVEGQTEWEVLVIPQTEGAPTPETVGLTTTGTSSYVKTGLTSNTAYNIYVRAVCAASQKSGWVGPKAFRTLCEAFGDFMEDFTNTTASANMIPNCWTKTVVSTNTNVNVSVISGNNSASAPNAIYMTNSNDITAQVLLVSPALTSIGANTHRMKFKAKSTTAGNTVIVGTMTDPANAATFTAVQTIDLGIAYNTYSVSLNTSTTDSYVAFKHGQGAAYVSVYLDDIEWESIPSSVPGCIEDMNVVINEGCGNFPTTFSWSAVQGADGYSVSIGTSEDGGDLVINNENIYSALNYSFVGNRATEYFYNITPYNAFGTSIGCAEDSFTTYDDGCYCAAIPSSLDGDGISNVQIGQTYFSVAAVTNASFIENGAVNITQGVTTNMAITLATGYAYYTEIWIDYNDNYTFEPSELIYTGQAPSNANPTIQNTSFMLSPTANLGEHRMRTVSTYAKQIPANPCYSGTWGIALDFLVNVLPAPPCLPPTASTVSNITANEATLTWVSSGATFNVEQLFAGESQGTGIVISGIIGNTTTLTSLDPQADYIYYVQADCGTEDGLSPWAGPFAFRTGCESFDDFVENFTTEENYLAPECWYTLKQSTDQNSYVKNFSYNDYMQFYTANDAAAKLYLVTPSLTALSLDTHRIKFKAYSPNAGQTVIVGTMTDPSNASTFTSVQTIQLTAAWADYAVTFLNSTTDAHVAFKFVGTANYQYLYLDDVIWETAPTCADIYVVNFVSSTATTADISWAPGGAEVAWQYAYSLATETEPGSLPNFDITTSTATITDLEPSTSYKVWVRASCGTGFGNWSPAKTFTTACAAVNSYPWTENFEGLTTVSSNSFPPCWFKENGDWSTSNQVSFNTPRSGSKYLRNNWSATNEYIWSPGFELTAGTSYDFSFFMQGDGYTGWNVDVFQNTVQNSSGATQLGTTTTASGAGSYVIQNYALISNTIVPTTSGTYYFAVRVNQLSSAPNFIAFDDFRMEPTPTCIAPMAPSATNITVSSATMNWAQTTPTPANGYDYYVTNSATAPIATTVPTGTVGAGITTKNLTGLNGSTVYKIYVRSICGESDSSSWSDAGTFTTDCVNAELPYTIDFENIVIPNLPLCTTSQNVGTGNNWSTQASSGYGFTSNVLNYSYSSSGNANAWFFSNKVTLAGGTTYSVSYQYSNAGSYPEKMKVAYGSTPDAAAMMSEISDHPSITLGAMQENTATFTPATSGDYVLGFNVYSDADQNQLYLDNIVIQEVLGASDFDNKSFTAYPNPVKDVLNVSSTQNISDVAVYNILGQQVLLMNMNANKGLVDMSSLAAGTYLVKVNSDNGVKTIKVIKE